MCSYSLYKIMVKVWERVLVCLCGCVAVLHFLLENFLWHFSLFASLSFTPSPFIIAYSLCTKFPMHPPNGNFIFCHNNCPFQLLSSLYRVSVSICSIFSRFILCAPYYYICEVTVWIKTENLSMHFSLYIDFLSVALEFIFYQKKETFAIFSTNQIIGLRILIEIKWNGNLLR